MIGVGVVSTRAFFFSYRSLPPFRMHHFSLLKTLNRRERPPSPKEFRRLPENRGTSRYVWPHMENKEYNILNNRYMGKNHEEQVILDRAKQKVNGLVGF